MLEGFCCNNPQDYCPGCHQVAIFNDGYLDPKNLSNVLRDIAEERNLDLITKDWGSLLRSSSDYFIEANGPGSESMASIWVNSLSGILQVDGMARDSPSVLHGPWKGMAFLLRLLCSSSQGIQKQQGGLMMNNAVFEVNFYYFNGD